MEKRYDIKLQTFFEEYENLLTQKNESCKRSFSSQVENMKKNNSDYIKTMENRMKEVLPSDFNESVENIDLKNKIDTLVKDLGLVNHDEVGKYMHEIKEEYDLRISFTSKSVEIVENLTSAHEDSINIIKESINNINTQLSRIDTSTTNGENEINSRNNPYIRNHESIPRDKTNDQRTELIMFLDSNGKFLEDRKLLTIKWNTFNRCGNINKINNFINGDIIYNNLKYILINVGVNDIDENSGEAVFNQIQETIDIIREKYNTVKIILSEITPRKDNRDDEVIACNSLINEYADRNNFIFVAHHSNLRDSNGSFLFDCKHIKKNYIPRFAANLKMALRKAYNITAPAYSHSQTHREHYNRPVPTNTKPLYPQHNYEFFNNESNFDCYETFKNELKRKLLAVFE